MQPGDEVTLQTMDGQEYCYQVATLETLTSTATKEMTAGGLPPDTFHLRLQRSGAYYRALPTKSITKASCRSGVSVRLAACLFCGSDTLKNSTNPKKRTWWLTEMEDSLERRQESYDGTHFAFLQKLDDFEIAVLDF